MFNQISRRAFLHFVGIASTTAGISAIAGCVAPVAPGASVAATPEPPSTESEAVVELRFWQPRGAKKGEIFAELMETYNTTQGIEDKVHVTPEVVPTAEMPQKLTAARIAGTEPDIFQLSQPTKLYAESGVILPLPEEDQAYVRQNYIPGVIQEATYQDQVWGYPMGTQAAALYYRRSFFEKAGITEPPKSTVEVRELAKELTQTIDGKKHYGFVREYDNNWLSVDWEELVWRFGGEPYQFVGDRPVQVTVNTPEFKAALTWLLDMINDGSTQLFDMTGAEAFDNGLAIMGRAEVSWGLRIKNEGDPAVSEDLWWVAEPAAPGVSPRVRSNGWHYYCSKTTKYPEQAFKFLRWMAHKPEMRGTRYNVEVHGSIPNVIDYPTPIAAWTEGMNNGFALETPPIMQTRPGRLVKGGDEIKETIAATMEAILRKTVELDPALEALQPTVDSILARTDLF